METKLTLKLDQNVIQSVKRYAGENRRSVSKLAEDYFRRLAGERISKRRDSPLVEDLSGVVSETGASTEDFAAREHHIATLLTRNVRDYKVRDLLVQTPEEYLKSFR